MVPTTEAVFECLSDNGIMACITVRRNARIKETNYTFRNLSVISPEKQFAKMEESVKYRREGSQKQYFLV
jgi:hypothetical protein